MAKPGVALQTYTVRDQAEKDYVGTLKAVAAMGYPAAELHSTGGFSAGELKRLLDDLGLAVCSTHCPLDVLEKQADKEVAYFQELGARYIGIAALPQAMRNRDGFLAAAVAMNRIGKRFQELGVTLFYHNHAFEFERFDGQYGLDLLLGACDPALVKWEPDVYWIKFGGEDPATYIRKYAGRTPLVHLKDMTADSSRTFAEVGEGILDWPGIFAACEASGPEWYIVEQDRWARPSLEAAALSLKHLKEWGRL